MSVDYRPDYDPADVNSDYGHTGGDITVPTFTGDTRPFRFWCQKALPLVYDDSLSYYEVLCKMADYMNNFMTDLTTVEDSMTEFEQQFVINQQFLNSMADQLGQNVADLEAYINDRMDDFMTAYTQLQTYVNNYFDNLDVQQEINTKLDEMASDGTLNDLFDPVLETWMQQKTAQIDAAIANQDTIQAAQNARISVLEGRMDTFSGLPSGSTSGNAELLDIRTNFLGETYPTAGDAVRASDMIASGFQSIGFSRLTEWNGNESDSRFDTIQIDVSAYKGGHMAVIANTYQFVNDIEQGAGIELFGTNVAGKTVDGNAHQYPFPDGVSGIPSPVFKDFTVLTTSVQDEERILIQLAIPEDFQYQYLKLGNVAPIPGEGYSYTQPAAIVYANSWSKTQVDPTLTITGAAADAKSTGDALDELNERMSDITSLSSNLLDVSKLTPTWIEPSGSEQFSSNNQTSDYIPVTVGDTLYFWGNNGSTYVATSYRALVAYNSSKQSISDEYVTWTKPSYTVPSGVAYIRVIIPNTIVDTYTNLYVGKHQTGVDYEPYSYVLNIPSDITDAIEENTANIAENTANIAENTNVLNNITKDSSNLLDIDKLTAQYIPADGSINTSVNLHVTDYLPVIPGESIYGWGKNNGVNTAITFRFVCAYDSDKEVVQSAGKNLESTPPYIVPEGIAFVRITIKNAIMTYDNLYIGTHNVGVDYEPYGKVLNLPQSENAVYTVHSGESILAGVLYCYANSIKNLVVESGTYDIIDEYEDEYGSDYFDNYIDYAQGNLFDAGIWLHDITVKFSAGAKVVCKYTGNNQNVIDYFSAFATGNNVTIDGLVLDTENLRYAIHADYNSGDNESFFIVRNCDIKNVRSDGNKCIGAGLGKHVNWLFENNIFRTTGNYYAMRIHNNVNSDAQSKIIVKDCYIDGDGYFKFNAYSTSTKQTIIQVCGCSYKTEPVVGRETPNSNDNFTLIAWNNELRNS